MGKGLHIEYSDAFFNMRRRFYLESRDRALAHRRRNRSLSQQAQEIGESAENRKKGKDNQQHLISLSVDP
jgi:hypothetical protein